MGIATEIVTGLTSAISSYANGFATGLKEMIMQIFLVAGENGNYTLSIVGTVVVAFGAVALAVGLSKWVLRFVTSFGRSK